MKRIITGLILSIFFILLFFFYYIDIGFVSPKTIFLFALSAITFLFLRKKIPTDKISTVILIFALYVMALKLFVFKNSLFDTLNYGIIYVITPYLIIYVILSLVNTKEKFKDAVNLLILISTINAIFVIGQFLGIDLFWKIRDLISPLPYDMARPIGLANYSIDLSYILVLLVPVSFIYLDNLITSVFNFFSIYFKKNDIPKPRVVITLLKESIKNSKILLTLIIIVSVILSLTRTSTFIVLLMILVFIFYIFSGKPKVVQISFMTLTGLIIAATILFIGLDKLDRLTTLEDSSALGRIDLFSQALKSIREYPLGLDGNGYKERWSTYLTPHNQYLNIAAFYGIPALCILLLFTYLIFKKSITEIKKAKDTYFKKINFILLLSLIGFTFNSLFHNAGFFNGNSEVYVIIGLIIASGKLRIKNETKNIRHNVSI